MKIAYFDESGDDGFPQYSSIFFVLTALYFDHTNWKSLFDEHRCFRKQIQNSFGLPVQMEMHTKNFLLNKKPYKTLSISNSNRIKVIDYYCDHLAKLDNLKIINVVIVKPRITKKDYQILDKALTFSIQRIENDLKANAEHENFMIITDPGRTGKMIKTARRLQIYNPIPSKYARGVIREEIKCLIEDPLPKNSKESYFIQIADLVTTIVSYYSVIETQFGCFPKRLRNTLTPEKTMEWMEKLKPILNLKATSKNPFGVYFHPNK